MPCRQVNSGSQVQLAHRSSGFSPAGETSKIAGGVGEVFLSHGACDVNWSIHERNAMQTGGGLEKRGRALENEFFRRVDETLAVKLRDQLKKEALRKHLSEASG